MMQQIASALPRTAVRERPPVAAIAPGRAQPLTPGGIDPYELRVFYLRYHGYECYFPLWALARYRNLKGGKARYPDYGL